MIDHKCPYGAAGCGETHDCPRCELSFKAKAYKSLTAAEKAYDNQVDPLGFYHTEFPTGCSCHSLAPCQYCTRDTLSPQ